ncbi:MAG TPA: hypothetical protein VFO85_21955 [Vicinamibacteria bacterium]|nr:hypothetical protein [Vicinamibacteria bacterium]
MSALFDARGCLTEAGVAALAGAPSGQAPAEVAAHLAGCGRCQDRLLARERVPATTSARRGRPYTTLMMVGGLLLLTLVMLAVTLVALGGR